MRHVSENAWWLEEGRDLSHSKDPERLRKSIIYFRKLKQRTPKWLTDEQKRKTDRLYRRMRKMRKQGHNVTIDHIVPLRSALVCGLHVHWNLKIMHAIPNFSKSNHWWPDCPHHVEDFFGDRYEMPEPHQLRLI